MNYGHIIYGHVCSGTWVYFTDFTINYVWSRFIFILLRSRFPCFSCSSLCNFVLSQTVDVYVHLAFGKRYASQFLRAVQRCRSTCGNGIQNERCVVTENVAAEITRQPNKIKHSSIFLLQNLTVLCSTALKSAGGVNDGHARSSSRSGAIAGHSGIASFS